jgi:phospholipid transport system substrate-binding protein
MQMQPTGVRQMLRKVLSVLSVTTFIAFSGQLHAQEAPDKMVQRVTAEVMTAVKADRDIRKGDRRSIQQVINDLILPNLDFERTTMLAMGRYWREATPTQQKQIEEQFRLLLIYTYSGAMSQIRDQKIQYEPLRADPADTDVALYANAISTGGQPIRFGYRLIKSPAGWKVYNVNVLGAWLVEAYKENFASEIRSSGIDGLIKTLTEKNKRLAANPVKVDASKLGTAVPPINDAQPSGQ